MKIVIKFAKLVYRLRNADHYEFYREIIRFVDKYRNILGSLLKPLLALIATFEKEDEIFKRSAQAVETVDINEAHLERMNIFRRIKLRIETAHYEKDPAQQAAADALDFVLNNFKSIPSTSMTQASALIVNMIQDLRLPRYTAHVTALSLTSSIDELETANVAFEDLLFEREQSHSSAVVAGNMKAARPKTDRDGLYFADVLNALYLLAKVDGRTADMETYGKLIDGINGIILYYEKKYAQIGGGGSPSKPGTDGDDDDDDDDLTPTFAIAAQAVTNGSTMYITLSNPDTAGWLFDQVVGATLILLLDPEAGVTSFDLFPITGLELSQESGETDKPIGLKVGPQANSTFDVPTYNAGPCQAWIEKDDLILAYLTGAFYPGSITEGRKLD